MTRRGLFELLVAAPLAKFFPKKDILLKAGDRLSINLIGSVPSVIGSAVLYNRSFVASILENQFYNKKALESLRKNFVFKDFIEKGAGQTILFDRKPTPTQTTFDFYDDYIDNSGDDDWGEYD